MTMDVIVDKSKRDYSYTSRYAPFPYYYNTEDKKYIYGLTDNLKNTTEYVIHYIDQNDDLDYLALKYYGRPDLFWVIADFNRIQDPFINLYEEYNYIYVPSLSSIVYRR